MEQFPDLPQELHYLSEINVEETQYSEFKAVQLSKKPIDVMLKHCREYLNAYLNTRGGSIWFAIEDDGTVKGLMLTRKDRDDIRLGLDGILNSIIPQVDAALVRLDFIAVIDGSHLGLEPLPLDMESHKKRERFVIVAHALPGPAPVYFTTRTRQSAYIRRDGGITKLSNDAVVSRLTRGRRRSISHMQQPMLQHTYPAIIGRREEMKRAKAFFERQGPPGRLLLLHGLPACGKSLLAGHVVSHLQQQFPAARCVQLDLKGALIRYLPVEDAMRTIIRTVRPDLVEQLAEIPVVRATPPQTPRGAPPLTIFSTDASDVMGRLLGGLVPGGPSVDAELHELYLNAFQGEMPAILHFENVGPDQLRQLVPSGRRAFIVATTRTSPDTTALASPGTAVLELPVEPLEPEDAASLALTLAPRILTTEQARRLAELSGGMPQAIKLMCGRIKQLSDADVLLDALAAYPAHQRLSTLAPALGKVIRDLPPVLKYALSRLSIFPGPFNIDSATAVLSKSRASCLSIVSDLVSRALVDPSETERRGWRVNDVIRSMAPRMPPKDGETTVRALVRHMARYATRLNSELVTRHQVLSTHGRGGKSKSQRRAHLESFSGPNGVFARFDFVQGTFQLALAATMFLGGSCDSDIANEAWLNCDRLVRGLGAFEERMISPLSALWQAATEWVGGRGDPQGGEILEKAGLDGLSRDVSCDVSSIDK
eukprot:gnl/Dysnectes_brevis/4566_a6195_507.p1 GENE.gnl/Dysnectes_brevis/4566_a6195_507~~gnl/Dysnectes_brevis/4566_a6195_507.p1  ORF type:complete len:711 (+),score=118.06 gnl/Dysnectes_brevis/4566_a6195_507:510-2642(+)